MPAWRAVRCGSPARARSGVLGDRERDPLQRGRLQRAVAQLAAEAGVAAQRGRGAGQDAEEVGELARRGQRALEDGQRSLRRAQLVVDVEAAHLCLHDNRQIWGGRGGAADGASLTLHKCSFRRPKSQPNFRLNDRPGRTCRVYVRARALGSLRAPDRVAVAGRSRRVTPPSCPGSRIGTQSRTVRSIFYVFDRLRRLRGTATNGASRPAGSVPQNPPAWPRPGGPPAWPRPGGPPAWPPPGGPRLRPRLRRSAPYGLRSGRWRWR